MEGLYKYHGLPHILHRALEPRGRGGGEEKGEKKKKKEAKRGIHSTMEPTWAFTAALGGHLREDLDSMQQT